MYTKATVIAPVIKFQIALNHKAEGVRPVKEHFFVFSYKCYISNHSYKIITNSMLYFGGTISYLGKTDYSDVFCYPPHGLVNISISCTTDQRFELLNSTLGIILSTIKGRKASWIGYISRRNCFLKQAI
jgi:hypothetical protein